MIDIPTENLIRYAKYNGYSAYVKEDNTINITMIKSALHRINDRLQQFQKKGYTESSEYERLVEKASVIGKGIKTNAKTGRLTFSESVKGLSNNDIKMVLKLGGHKLNTKKTAFESLTYGQARLNAIKHLKSQGNTNPTNDDVKMQLAKEKRVHEFIQNHALDIYQVQELCDAVHRPWDEKLTLEEMDKLLTMYEKKEYYDEDGNFVGDRKRDSQGILI